MHGIKGKQCIISILTIIIDLFKALQPHKLRPIISIILITMKGHNSKLPLLFTASIMILLLARICSCRDFHGTLREDHHHHHHHQYQQQEGWQEHDDHQHHHRDSRIETYRRLISGHFTSAKADKNDPIFGSSLRFTPGGPNPLHN